MAMAMDMNSEQTEKLKELFEKEIRPLNEEASLHLFPLTDKTRLKAKDFIDAAQRELHRKE